MSRKKGVVENAESSIAPAETVTRRAYRVGGSVAVRLPKDMADALGISEGTPVRFKRLRTGIMVEPAT